MAKALNTFLKSKMNKDLDARLIPSGEYRNAVNVQISKSEGDSVGSDYKFAGPGKMILAATGLTDELDNFRFFYDEASDVMKFRAAWRLGVGVGEVNLFATNDMA